MMRSFRVQLALRATLAATLGLAALSAVTLTTLTVLLDREVNASILSVASIQAASLADGPDGAMHFHEWDLSADEAASVRDLIRYAQVWAVDGRSLLRSQYMTSDLPSDADALALASVGELVWAQQDFEGTPVRSLFYPLERLGVAHEAHVLQVAAPLAARNGMLVRAAAFLGLLTVLLAAATFAGSWWLAGSAVLPIHAVIDQAEEIGARSLDRRIQAYADTVEYRRLVDVLNTMLGRIQGSFEAQRRFAADASHEMRSPLTAMRGEIEIALRRERDREEYVRVLGSTLEEVVRLTAITEDLLTLARSDAGAMSPRLEVADAAGVVLAVVERLRPRAVSKGVALNVAAEPAITAVIDGGLLGQAAWNLMDNALKFTPSGGRVDVSVVAVDGQVVLTVEDTGPGLGEVEQATVFARFYRADSARTHGREMGGTGLGLAIVKAVAEAHGGEANAEDRPTGGARFTVRLPSAPSIEA
ncbi:MAG: ATP-binding protein [Gemmatimonadetes bacterium]|nr:ATP-binding protein [Gemmatimonadota bacterium]MDA1102407.1 ATP-binding protein [Gemmatimonadota bacterium]